MTDKAKFKALSTTNQNFRYSQTSSNSTENSELDYYLYCYSQGYRNLEKGYWRGVLRAKNVDFDLRYNKEWNRRIELEDDDTENTNFSTGKSGVQIPGSGKFSSEYLTFINDNEIGWDMDRFKNFQKYQHQVGMKKQKNKEWLLSNGVKRTPFNAEIRTQSFKQFEANEKLKKDKKGSYLDKNKPGADVDVYEYEKEDKYSYGTGVNMSQNIQAYQDQALKSLTVLAHQLAIVKNLNLAKSLMVMISNILKITIPKEDL